MKKNEEQARNCEEDQKKWSKKLFPEKFAFLTKKNIFPRKTNLKRKNMKKRNYDFLHSQWSYKNHLIIPKKETENLKKLNFFEKEKKFKNSKLAKSLKYA